jgi:hypothetical protein
MVLLPPNFAFSPSIRSFSAACEGRGFLRRPAGAGPFRAVHPFMNLFEGNVASPVSGGFLSWSSPDVARGWIDLECYGVTGRGE